MSDFGPFRPLRPFQENDRSLFFGRERELGELQERLAQDRPSALLLGEAGIGKTSLVRAGLLPALKSRGVSCALVDASELGAAHLPQASAAGSLLVLDDLGAALDEGPRTEQLLALLSQAGEVRELKILFILDDADLWRLDGLERRIGHVGPLASRLRLERFDEAQAADAIERTVLGGGAYFEAGLSHELAVDLAHRGPVSPSELQLVAGSAVAQRLTTLKAWRRGGGAEVATWRFFDQACAQSASGGRSAARVLAELAAHEPREAVGKGELARAAGVDEAAVEKIAAGLARFNLVRRQGERVLLGSEWVRPFARAYTGEARGRGVAARLLLRRKIEGGGLLSVGAVREIKRFGGTLEPDEEKVVKRSVQVGLAAAALVLAIPVVVLALLYTSNGRSAYLDAGPAPGAPVVARLGRGARAMTSLPHSPAFGSVIADSGFSRAALKDGVPEGAGPRAGDAWLRRLEGALRPLPQAAVALILDGDVKPLATAYQDAALRPALLGVLGAAGRGGPDEIALLERAVGDVTAEDVRRRAVEAAAAIERRAPGKAVEVLAAGLKDAAPSVRALAMQEIVKLPDAQSAPLCATALAETSDPVVRREALDALGEKVARTPAAAQALGKAMRGPARGDAAEILDRLLATSGPSADAAAQALTALALDPKAPDDARIDALKRLRRRSTTPAGIAAISGSPKVMAAAMPLVLRATPDQAAAKVVAAMHGPAPLRAAAAAAIGLLPKTADTPKQLKVLEYDSNSEVHAEAVRALPVLGREALPLIVKEAKGGGAEVERAAVETLGAQAARLGASAATQALEMIIKTARPSTRKAAIDAIGRIAIDRPGLAAGALGRLSRDKAADVRAEAASSLGDVLAHGSKEAVSALRAIARDPDPETRKRAATALGEAPRPLATQAARALAAFAGDADPSVRVAAAQALGTLGASLHAVEPSPLAGLLADKDPDVRAAARKAAQAIGAGGRELDKILLASFAGAPVAARIEIAKTAGAVGAASTVRAALADPDAGVRRAAAEHAGGLGPEHVSALVAALGDPDQAVRVAAVRGLVGAKAGDALVEAARSPDLAVRAAALEAAGQVGGASARAALTSALGDASEGIRVAAARGLVGLGPQAGELLEKALRDPSRDVREAAVEGLGILWAELPPAELAMRLRDETDADRRYAAALALARQGDGAHGTEARKIVDDAAEKGTPAVRMTARVARAFAGRADDMAGFVRLLRDGT